MAEAVQARCSQWIEYKNQRGLRGRRTSFVPVRGNEMNEIETIVRVARQKALDEQASGLDADLRIGVDADTAEGRKGQWTVRVRADTVLALCDEIDRLRAENAALRAGFDWLERKARQRKLEIAPSIYGTGFEFGFWPECRAVVVSAKTLAEAVAKAQEQQT